MTRIDVCFVTWPRHSLRIDSFQRCVALWRQHLHCDPDDEIHWHCSTETQDCNHEQLASVREACNATPGYPAIALSEQPGPADQGTNLNVAMRMARGDFIIMVMDDFHLTRGLNVSIHCRWLQDNPEVACIRYGWKITTFIGDIPDTDLQWVNLAGSYPYATEPALMRGKWESEFGAWKENHGIAGPENTMVGVMRRSGRPIAATRIEIAEWVGTASCLPERWNDSQREALKAEMKS